MDSMNKSFSESNLNEVNKENSPLDFVSQRPNKRRKHDEYLSDLCDFKDEIKSMLKEFKISQEKELKAIIPTLKEIQYTNQNIESSIAFLTTQNLELKKKIEQMETKTKEDKEHILILEDKIEDLQRGIRKSSIEIKNVPRKNGETKEDLISMTFSLAKNINYSIEKSDIRDIYRIKQRKNDSRIINTPIVIEMSSTMGKTEILQKCKLFNVKNKDKIRAKHLGLTTKEDTPVFVSEQLTSRGSRLYFLARDLAKYKNYRFCWTSFGKVFIRKDENSPIITIRNEDQVCKLKQGD